MKVATQLFKNKDYNFKKKMSELSLEQKYAYEKVCRGENVFITGPGGSGKSYLIDKIVKYLTSKGICYQITSTTGCSAVLLSNNIQINGNNVNVKTIHSFSGIALCKGENEIIINNAVNNSFLSKRWRQVKVLIIDEVSMMSCKIFNVIETIARKTRRNDKPFGNIQIILLGDFLQLPPIHDIHDPETAKFCFESDKWYTTIPLQNHIELKTIFRQKDEIFRNLLSEIRIGEISKMNEGILKSLIGKQYDPESNFGIIPLRILPTRKEVAFVNQSYYDTVKSKEYSFEYILKTKETITDGLIIPPGRSKKADILHANPTLMEIEIKNLKSNIPVEEFIYLKIGVPVMIMVNLDMDNSICNGTLGIVSNFSKNGDHFLPIIQFANGCERMIDFHMWKHPEFTTLTISQIPLTLAYASSIHKQQGSSIAMARMNLGKSVFEDSQIYVALSRMTSLDGLYLDSFESSKITVNKKAKEFYESFPVTDYECDLKNSLSIYPSSSSSSSSSSSFFSPPSTNQTKSNPFASFAFQSSSSSASTIIPTITTNSSSIKDISQCTVRTSSIKDFFQTV